MNCALWLNKRKVQHASEIHENLDIASLRGYFLAGSLCKWLFENDGTEYAEKLSALSADDPYLNEKLAEVFGGEPNYGKAMRSESGGDNERATTSPLDESPIGSLTAPSSGLPNSFGFAGYGSGSFSFPRLGSFGEFWELIKKLQAGSFGSFLWNFGSFGMHEWEWEWLYRLFGSGSFSYSSFGSLGLYRFGWLWGFGSFGGSGSFVPFGSFGALSELFGSFGFDPGAFPELDEYDRIMLETLMLCPLDRFGYGIHNI